MFQRRQVKTRSELLRGEFGKRIDRLRHTAGYGARAVSATVRPTLAAARVKVTPSAAWVRTATAQGWGSAVAGAAALLPLMAAARRSPTRANRPGALEAGAGKLARMAMMARSGKTAGRARARVIGKKGSRMSGTRTRMLVGLLAGGAAAGVAGAVISRRRFRTQWEEQESPAVGEVTGDAPLALDDTDFPEDKGPDKVAGRSAASSGRAAEMASTWTHPAKDPASKRSEAAGNASTVEPPGVTLTFGETKDKAEQLTEGAASGSKTSSRG